MHAYRVMRPLGSLLSLALLFSCSGGGGSHSALPTTNSASRRVGHVLTGGGGGCPEYPDGSVAVLNDLGTIYFYEGPLTNSSTPTATITLPTSTGTSGGLEFDAAGDLWVAYYQSSGPTAAVVEYAAPLTTGESPSITISGSNTGFDEPSAISYNASTSDIYVADASAQSISVFSATANGNVTPSATVSGSNTNFSNVPVAIKTDANYMYVGLGAGSGGIESFALSASGNATPRGIVSSYDISGFDFDTQGDLYYNSGGDTYLTQSWGGYPSDHLINAITGHYIGTDDAGNLYSAGGTDLYLYTVTYWVTRSTNLEATISLGSRSAYSLAVYSPGKFNGTAPL